MNSCGSTLGARVASLNPVWKKIATDAEELEPGQEVGFANPQRATLKRTKTGPQDPGVITSTITAAVAVGSCLIASPSSRWRQTWDVIGMLFLGYDIVMVPLQV